jgi:hypothetical protein
MGRTTAAVARKSRQFAIPPLVSIYIHCWDWSSKAFQGFTGDSPFFAASKLGLEAHFCTLEMGLIDRSIDCSVKRCRPVWSIRMIRRCLKWSGAPLCSGICCDNRVEGHRRSRRCWLRNVPGPRHFLNLAANGAPRLRAVAHGARR